VAVGWVRRSRDRTVIELAYFSHLLHNSLRSCRSLWCDPDGWFPIFPGSSRATISITRGLASRNIWLSNVGVRPLQNA
jgi:hypothetical protein